MWTNILAITCLGTLAFSSANSANWIAPNWGENEPQYPPGSLFWKTNEYPRCPVVYRMVLDVDDKPLTGAMFRVNALDYAYVFLNSQQIAGYAKKDDESNHISLDVQLDYALKPGKNVIIISVKSDGFSLTGYVKYNDENIQRFSSDMQNWKAQKLPPLTMLEFEPFMKPDFDDKDWFSVKEKDEKPLAISDSQMGEISQHLTQERSKKLDEDAKWRLNMLKNKGIAIVDWEAYVWAGSERLPNWIKDSAKEALNKESETGWLHNVAEALTSYAYISDMATNFENHVVGLKVLDAENEEIEVFRKSADSLHNILDNMKQKIIDGKYDQASETALEGKKAIDEVRSKFLINDLNSCLENKFGWFDNNTILGNDISDWGLQINSPVSIFASPLSPAAYVTVENDNLIIQGWDALKPIKVYNKPANLGPICLWVVQEGKVKNLKPGEGGLVYDRKINGDLSENWAVLIHDLASGGDLPIEFVFLNHPEKIIFKPGENGTNEVIISFNKPGAKLFILRPLKEWRGLLQQAKEFKNDPVNENSSSQYISQFRLWSKALLNYPVTFSEVFKKDPQNQFSIICSDVYNYWELKDEWNTEPLKLAPLSPLATYGLMMNHPGLEVISKTQNLGSRGVWGDHIGAVDQDYIIYRVPIGSIKRFGGFTSYCFGGTDIGEAGSITEIETIKRTGSNTFRPQHNQTGDRAMRTLQWCWERGVQNVFNTDEKWVSDVVEHFRILAQKCKDYPPDAMAYDLLNEPETRFPKDYNPLMRKITAAIREFDKTHLIYVEVFPPWAPLASPFPQAAFDNLEPTGDELTCYSFHDYEYRLPARWPNEENDIRSLLNRWIPAFKYGIDHRQPIHLGEFGGFEQTEESVYDNRCAFTMMMDHFKIFDQFGWHWHYYANRGTVRVRRDGSLQDSYVQEAHRQYFAKGRFNANR